MDDETHELLIWKPNFAKITSAPSQMSQKQTRAKVSFKSKLWKLLKEPPAAPTHETATPDFFQASALSQSIGILASSQAVQFRNIFGEVQHGWLFLTTLFKATSSSSSSGYTPPCPTCVDAVTNRRPLDIDDIASHLDLSCRRATAHVQLRMRACAECNAGAGRPGPSFDCDDGSENECGSDCHHGCDASTSAQPWL